jgi:hypothetical protein
MANSKNHPHRQAIDAWLVKHRIGQLTVSVRRNIQKRHWRAFLCTYWKGGNILEFTFYADGGFNVRIISTRNDAEETVGELTYQH